MTFKRIALAGAALLMIAAPLSASADPWNGGPPDGWHGDQGGAWRDHQDYGPADDHWGGGWHDRGWGDHDRWEHRFDGYGSAPRCFWTDHGHYNWWGQYEVRQIRVCR